MASEPSSQKWVSREDAPGSKNEEVMAEHGGFATEQDMIEVVHADGTVHYLDSRVVGGELETMPKGYYGSFSFIGTVIVRTGSLRLPHNFRTFPNPVPPPPLKINELLAGVLVG